MKISYNWLQKYLETSLKAAELSAILTNTGLEVEAIELWSDIPGGLLGLIIGEVIDVKKHPEADRLNLTQVLTEAGTNLQIVCGAPNIAIGQKVVVAPVGTTIYPTKGSPVMITRSKIRGIWSEGMICSEDEIGLGDAHEGILVLSPVAIPGELLTSHLSVTADQVFEIGITPNRSDALSHKGVARDVLAYLHAHKPLNAENSELRYASESIDSPSAMPILEASKEASHLISLSIDSPDECIRFSGIVIADLKVMPSPAWLQNSLKAIGIRPINNIVDATNFILHDMGQPMHAYDLREIKGGAIRASRLSGINSFTTLDGVERKILDSDLMICDAHGPLGIAGVFGGLNSGIKDDTTAIFLESACFNPVSIRKTARRLGLKTDASFRFERGTDADMTLAALEKACKLILEIAGGKIGSELQDIYPVKKLPVEVNLRREKLDALIGSHIESEQVKAILSGLGIGLLKYTPDTDGQLESWLLSIPLFKVDVTREADVIEEVLRIYGFNAIQAPTQLRSSLPFTLKVDPEQVRETAANWLSAAGFNEIMTNSLSSSLYLELKGPELSNEAVHVLNPLSNDLDVLRQTLLYSGLKMVAYNHNRKIENLKCYEFGKTYHKLEGKYQERNQLSLFLSGNDFPESWIIESRPVNLYHIKGYIDSLLKRLDVPVVSRSVNTIEWLTESLSWDRRKVSIGHAGLVSQVLLKTFGIHTDVWYVTLNWDNVLKSRNDEKLLTTAIPRFPAVRRDLSLLIDKELEFSKLKSVALQAGIAILKEVDLFDVYEGDKIESGKKSYAMRFMLECADHTLTEIEIDEALNKLIKQLSEKTGAIVRNK